MSSRSTIPSAHRFPAFVNDLASQALLEEETDQLSTQPFLVVSDNGKDVSTFPSAKCVLGGFRSRSELETHAKQMTNEPKRLSYLVCESTNGALGRLLKLYEPYLYNVVRRSVHDTPLEQGVSGSDVATEPDFTGWITSASCA